MTSASDCGGTMPLGGASGVAGAADGAGVLLQFPLTDTQSIEYHLVKMFETIESLRLRRCANSVNSANGRTNTCCGGNCADCARGDCASGDAHLPALPLSVEMRSLELWRAVTCECLGAFLYVFIVCGAAAGVGPGASLSALLTATALAAGLAMATLVQCVGHISGAHISPAISLAMVITKKISPLRCVMYIVAQCGGSIAGAAVLHGITIPGYQSNLSSLTSHTLNVAAWERFANEFILSFVIVMMYFMSMDTYRRWTGSSGLAIGCAYTACTFVSMPHLNPARSLGPAFVLNNWDNHWVYWLGPALSAGCSAVFYNSMLNPRRRTHLITRKLQHQQQRKKHRNAHQQGSAGSASSLSSDGDHFDDLEKGDGGGEAKVTSMSSSYRPTGGTAALKGAGHQHQPLTGKLERAESLYGGTKSLYCKSPPPLRRATLNRSQSVYAKSNTAVHTAGRDRDLNCGSLPRSSNLTPAQSMYPFRVNHGDDGGHQAIASKVCAVSQNRTGAHIQNQNLQNQQMVQRCTENIYGVRGVTPGTAKSGQVDDYVAVSSASTASTNSQSGRDGSRPPHRNRPESLYGMVVDGSGRSRGGYAHSGNESDSGWSATRHQQYQQQQQKPMLPPLPPHQQQIFPSGCPPYMPKAPPVSYMVSKEQARPPPNGRTGGGGAMHGSQMTGKGYHAGSGMKHHSPGSQY